MQNKSHYDIQLNRATFLNDLDLIFFSRGNGKCG